MNRPINRRRLQLGSVGGGLTRREAEVCMLLVNGFEQREIADRLVISVRTVEVHERNVRRKLNVRNRVSAAVKLVTLGYGGY